MWDLLGAPLPALTTLPMLGATACVAIQQVRRAREGGVDAQHHGWAATVSALAFGVLLGRFVQLSAPLPERALLGVGLTYTFAFGFGAAFLWFTPSAKRAQRRQLAVIPLVLLALHLALPVFVGREALPRVDAFGNPYFAVRNGPLTVALVPFAVVLLLFGLRAARQAGRKSPLKPGAWLLLACGITAVTAHDIAMNLGLIRSVHLIEYSLAVIGFVTSMSLSRRFMSRFAGLATAVDDRTKELGVQQAALERALDDLRAASGALPMLAESTLDAVLVHEDGRIVDANASASAMFGAPAGGLVGMSLAQLVSEGDRHAVTPSALDLSQGPHEIMGSRLDGSRVPLEVIGRRVTFEGASLGVVALRDITDRKAQQARQLLTDRMVSLGTLAAGAAHEINNPLAYTMANIAIVLKGAKGDGGAALSSSAVELLRDAEEGCERIRSIVRDLSTFSRGGSDVLEPVDVESVLELSIRMAEPVTRGRARVVRDYAEVGPVRANRTQLGQVFLNLLLNAAQAIPAGSVEGHEIRIATSEHQGRVVVAVHDTGVGIEAGVLSRIFVPFFTTKAQEGTGLGLSVCHGIVTQLGGEIDVESAPGEGSTFRVVLPSFEPSPPQPPAG
jgi:PAS domain S-box-containing protein